MSMNPECGVVGAPGQHPWRISVLSLSFGLSRIGCLSHNLIPVPLFCFISLLVLLFYFIALLPMLSMLVGFVLFFSGL